MSSSIDVKNSRFPFCIVWTPIPCITWFLPWIGHMGIGTSTGVIRDFAGSYFVSEDDMAFGKPTKYWQLDEKRVVGGMDAWDKAIADASEVYEGHCHYLLWDNCHSHVAMALNKMQYDHCTSWNMCKLVVLLSIHGKYVSVSSIVKTWLPFCLIVVTILIIFLTLIHPVF